MLRPRLRPLHIAAVLACAGSATLMPTTVMAQGAPKPADSGEVQTVTVTANRRAEDQQKVNVSVTAVSGAELEARNVTDLSQMESLSAGFTFGRSGADARPAIRGVRTENVAVNADTTIGYFVDGIYKSRAQQAMLGFTDVGRVEIMRGPQGTLFGRNTFGGTVAVSTNAPELRAFEANAALLGGSFGKLRFDGALNLPMGETAALRLAGTIDQADPFVKNDFNGAAGLFDQDLKYLRASLRLKPSRELDVLVRADFTEQGGNGGSAFGYKQAGTYLHSDSCQQLFNASRVVMNVRPGNRDAVNDCTRTVGAGNGLGGNAIGASVDLGVPLHKPGNAYRVDTDYATFLDLRDRNASIDLSYRLGQMTLKSITGYADFAATRTADSDFSASTIAVDYQKTTARTFTQELQLLSDPAAAVNWVVGAYFFKDALKGTFINQQLARTIRSSAITTPLALPVQGGGFYDNQLPGTESTALYGQVAAKVATNLTATAGVRWTRDTKSFRFANANSVLPRNQSGNPDTLQINLSTIEPSEAAYGRAGVSNCTGSNNNPGFNCDAGTNLLFGATYSDAVFSKTTGKLALDWQVNRDQLVYASLSTGFRSGGFNSGQALEAVRTFKPEEVTALELGSKNRFLANRLQVNLAAFTNAYTNLQEQRQVPVGSTTVSTIFNAAKAKASGMEVEAEWRLSRTTTLGGTLSLLDAKYTSFPDVALPFGTSILVADPSSTAPQTDANGIVIAPAGQRRVFAPGYRCGVVPGTGGTNQPAALFGCDLSGKRLPYAARHQGSVFLRHEMKIAGGTLTPMVVLGFSSGYFGQPTNAEIEKQGAYIKGDFKLNWRMGERFALQGFVDNIGDKQVINRFVWGGGGAMQVSAAAPRTYGLKLSYAMY